MLKIIFLILGVQGGEAPLRMTHFDKKLELFNFKKNNSCNILDTYCFGINFIGEKSEK